MECNYVQILKFYFYLSMTFGYFYTVYKCMYIFIDGYFFTSYYFAVVFPMCHSGWGREGGETFKTGGANKIPSVSYLMNVTKTCRKTYSAVSNIINVCMQRLVICCPTQPNLSN